METLDQRGGKKLKVSDKRLGGLKMSDYRVKQEIHDKKPWESYP